MVRMTCGRFISVGSVMIMRMCYGSLRDSVCYDHDNMGGDIVRDGGSGGGGARSVKFLHYKEGSESESSGQVSVYRSICVRMFQPPGGVTTHTVDCTSSSSSSSVSSGYKMFQSPERNKSGTCKRKGTITEHITLVFSETSGCVCVCLFVVFVGYNLRRKPD